MNRKIKGENREEQKIIDLLENENLSFDKIGKRLKLDASRLRRLFRWWK